MSITVNSDLVFPELDMTDLRNISLGSYQLKQVCSYFAEHTSSLGRFEIQVARHIGPLGFSSLGILAEEPMLLRVRIQSRHRSATKYHIYVLVDMAKRGA